MDRRRVRRGAYDGKPVGLVAEWLVWKQLLAAVRDNWIVILVPLAIALILRLLRLNNSDLWMDEIAIYRDALQGTFHSVSPAHRVHLKSAGWILNHISDSPVGLRLWGALLGSLTAPAMAIGGLWLAGRRNGMIWGILAALNPYLIQYSQDANYYGPMSFFAAAQLALYISFFRGAPLASLAGILGVGLVSHFNHPFASLLTAVALGGCILGSLIFGRIRQEIYAVNPRHWLQRPGIPVMLFMALFIGPKIGKAFLSSYKTLASMFEFGTPLKYAEFSFAFFHDVYTKFGVTMYHPGEAGKLLAFVPFLMALGGVVWLIAGQRKSIAHLPVAGLMVVAPIASYVVIFNIQANHGFYLRYFTFQVPLFLGAAGYFCHVVGEMAAGKDGGRDSAMKGAVPACAAAGVLCLIWVPFLANWYAADRSNFRTLSAELTTRWKPGETIYMPMNHDATQAHYYLGREEPRFYPGRVTNTRALPQANQMARSYLLHRLYGQESAWIISAWRHPVIPALWHFMQSGVPMIYGGTSAHGHLEDARLYHWLFGRRVLMPCGASRFDIGASEEKLLASRAGTWRISVRNKRDFSPGPDLHIEGPGTEVSRTENESWLVETDDVTRLTIRGTSGLSLQAVPVFADEEVIPPGESMDYVEDERMEEMELDNGREAIRREFDGMYSYVLWVDPKDDRQLVLLPMRRTKEFEEKGKTDPSRSPNGDLWLAVACDGKHLGMWRLPVGTEEKIVPIPTGIVLPAGNHRIDISGFTPRLGYLPYNPWTWAGMEWNREKQAPIRSLEESGLRFAKFPQAVYDWGEAGAEGLPLGYAEAAAGYHRQVSNNVKGPSGNPALVFDLTKPATDKQAYHTLFVTPFKVTPGEFVAFSSWLWMDGTTTHDAMLVTMFFDKDGQLVHRQLGSQQKMTGRLSFGWRRFVEVVPVPRGAVLAAPGVMIFPPDDRECSRESAYCLIFFPPKFFNLLHLPLVSFLQTAK